MKILMLHNHYQHRGGENAVFEAESALLAAHGHAVETVTFSNDDIQTPWQKAMAGVKGLYNPTSASILAQKIKAFQPDVLHLHNFFPVASPSVLYTARRMGVPTVVTLHNYRLICPKALLYRDGEVCERCVDKVLPLDGVRFQCYRNSGLQTTAVGLMTGVHKMLGTWQNQVNQYIALSQFAKNRLLDSSLNVPADKITVKPNFVTDPGVPEGIERQPYFLFVGRLSEEKAIDILVAAFQQTGLPLKIVGGGPLDHIVQAAATSHPNIQPLGPKSKEVVLDLMRQTQALVLPSICYEGCPMTILEAFSVGTPVIASNLGGPAVMVKDGETGLLVTPNHVNDLAQASQQVASDSEGQATMGQQARRTYEALYTPEANYQQLMAIYYQVQEAFVK
ncbi:MAG: glycosyltransferase family 4 protein [Vampirovibrio sp.]|nr:glycosyltransferase family 4 protein [Vampirovibrio sp.]